MRSFYVYILASWQRTLYVGVTNSLVGRVTQHKSGSGSHFTARYRVDRLVHAERFDSILEAIAREKQIKRWSRARKVALIESANPEWCDLAGDLG